MTQLPERHELWYDDGTAEPEFYYDRDWLQSNGTAALELLGMFSFIFGTVGVFAYVVDDGFRPVRARHWKWGTSARPRVHVQCESSGWARGGGPRRK